MKLRLRVPLALAWLPLAALLFSLANAVEPVAPVLDPPAATIESDAGPEYVTPAAGAFPGHRRALHLSQLGVDRWHRAGYRGRGVKVAILDSGFRGYRAHLGKALPAHVCIRSFRTDGNLEAKDSQHGILCGEVVHALAPDAELLLANWDPDQPHRFLEAVRWARQQGAQIISCSVIMPSWSDGEGGGPAHEVLGRILGDGSDPGDVLFFASAGNTARRHWTGDFADNGRGLHQWRQGRIDNRLTPWDESRVSVALCWPAGPRYRLSVHDADTGREVGSAEPGPGGADCSLVVRIRPWRGRRYVVRVELVEGQPGRFHVVALGADLDYTTAAGSIPFPADGPFVQAVGAVDEEGQREPYSSCGPNSQALKPNFVAPVPFPSLWRPRPFSGTSAAAPQVAGLAALVWSRHPKWTAAQVREALQEAALDLGQPGHDWETGHGLAILPGHEGPALVRPNVKKPPVEPVAANPAGG